LVLDQEVILSKLNKNLKRLVRKSASLLQKESNLIVVENFNSDKHKKFISLLSALGFRK
jgi:hypothetical protein